MATSEIIVVIFYMKEGGNRVKVSCTSNEASSNFKILVGVPSRRSYRLREVADFLAHVYRACDLS
jgi:hypothetical protein